jgi:hypothetical protein
MRRKYYSQLTIATCFAISYLLVNLSINSLWKFHQLHNDYWDLLFIAKNIDFSNPYSLFNPCIPIGYTSILHFVIKLGSEVTLPIIINLFFGTTTLFFSLLFYQKKLSRFGSIISTLLVGFFPLFFFYFNQGGADPGSVMFFSIGSFLIVEQLFLQNDKKKKNIYLIAGLLMGCGAIFRYHVLVGSAILLFTAFVFDIKNWKLILLSGIGVALSYSPQMIVNLLTNHGLLETKLGASNIYDLMYGINWYTISTEKISTHAREIISTNYFLFFKRYTISFVKFFIQTGIIPLLVTITNRRSEVRKISLFITVFIVLYFGFFSATLSGRQVLLPLPLSMLSLGFLIDDISSRTFKDIFRFRVYRILGIGFSSLVCISFFIKDISHINRNIKEYHFASDVESYLMQIGCTNAQQTYTTDYDFYFRNLPNYTGYFNGGWSRWGTYKYNEAFPEFSVVTLESFLNDCKRRNVNFLLLTKDTAKLSPELAEIFNLKVNRKDIVFKKEFDRIRIFQII